MFIIKIIFYGLVADLGLAKVFLEPLYADFPEVSDLKSNITKCNSAKSGTAEGTAQSGINLVQPFLDMTIQNDRNVFILHEREKQLLLVLHGNEMYQLIISKDEKKLNLLGLLGGGGQDNELLGAQVIHWQNYLLLGVVYADNIDIYQISLSSLENSKKSKKDTDAIVSFDLIQQLIMLGKFQKLYFMKTEEGKVLLIVAAQFTKIYGKLRTYEWQDTYFDPIEELTVPQMNFIQTIGIPSKYLVTGRALRGQEKTILNMYEVVQPTMSLRNIQTLTVGSRKVHAFTFRDRNFLVACSPKQQKKCNSFKMLDNQFLLYKQRSEKEYALDKIQAGETFLVGVRNAEIKVFYSQKLDCHLSFASNESDINSIIVYNNEQSQNFVILHYKRPFTSIFRIIEVYVQSDDVPRTTGPNWIDTEELPPNHQQHLFENTIGQLRSLLLKRRSAMDVFRRIATTIQPKMKYYQTKNNVTVHSGNIGIVKLVGSKLRSPYQLLERINLIRNSRLHKRFSREINLKNIKKKDLLLQVNSLYVENLIYDKPLIEGFFLDRPLKTMPILSVRKPISTKTVSTERLLTRSNYRYNHETVPNDESTFKVTNLNVESINGLAWSEFYESLFLKNRDKTIKGRLILQGPVEVDHLSTPLLNGLVVDNLFNLVKPQEINSDILFNGFLVSDLQAERINGLNFAEDIVFRGKDTVIETPVSMHEVSIAGELNVAAPSTFERQVDQDDLQQTYTGKVIINGSLTVKNLRRDLGDKTKIFVGDKVLSEAELKEKYLLNNTDQVFKMPVRFGNAKVSAPSLDTAFLNDHPTEQHLLNRPNHTSENPVYLVFMNVKAQKDIICKDYKSKIAKLKENIVLKGSVANITGQKIFKAPLQVDGLYTLSLNDLPVTDLVKKSDLSEKLHFTGNKTFDEIIVLEEAQIEENLESKMLNNFPLEDLLNYDYHMDRLVVDHELQILNLVFHKINGLSFDDAWLKFKIRDDKLVLSKDLIVEGNVQFMENLNVENINGINWTAYEKDLVKRNENAVIEGHKSFLNEVQVTRYLQTPFVNEIDFSLMFEKLLRNNTPQVINGNYSFGQMEASNVDVSVINDMPTSAFIDTSQPEVVIEGDLILKEMKVGGNLKGLYEEDFPFKDLDEKIKVLLDQPWKNIVVRGNAAWQRDNLTILADAHYEMFNYLYKNAVRKTGNQTISGNVRFQCPSITKMSTKTLFPKHVDIDFIAKDSLQKNTTNIQDFKGPKRFLKSLHAQKVIAHKGFQVDFLNNIDILRFNASLYRLKSGQPIQGPLHFLQPLTINNGSITGFINGMRVDQIYQLSKDEAPPVLVKNLIIDDLIIGDINGLSLDFLLENRITKTGKALEVFGHLTFENLKINKQARLQSINNIPIDNLVFKESNHLQAISGAKTVKGDLILQGPAHALRLNGLKLLDTYQKSLLKNENYNISTLIVDQVNFKGGLEFRDDFDNSFESEKKAESPKPRSNKEALSNHLENEGKEKNLFYLDYDFNKILLWSKPENKTFTKSWTFEMSLSSSVSTSLACNRSLLQMHQVSNSNEFYLQKVFRDFVSASRANLNVKAENFCKTSHQKAKSRIILSSANETEVIGMKKFVVGLDVLQLPTKNLPEYLVLLHGSIKLNNQSTNELCILKVNELLNNTQVWQTLNLGWGSAWKVFTIKNQNFLIASHMHSHFLGVVVYSLDFFSQKFKEIQRIPGTFDLIEMISLDNDNQYHLLLSCHHCHKVSIFLYQSNFTESPFLLTQTLKVPSNINSLTSFSVGPSSDSTQYLLVLSKLSNPNEYFLNLYELWEDWQSHSSGHLQNVSLALPLKNNQPSYSISDNVLLLLCGPDSQCSLVKTVLI